MPTNPSFCDSGHIYRFPVCVKIVSTRLRTCGNYGWIDPDALFMMELLIAFAVVFGIGFGVGYAVRERKSRMRRRRHY